MCFDFGLFEWNIRENNLSYDVFGVFLFGKKVLCLFCYLDLFMWVICCFDGYFIFNVVEIFELLYLDYVLLKWIVY